MDENLKSALHHSSGGPRWPSSSSSEKSPWGQQMCSPDTTPPTLGCPDPYPTQKSLPQGPAQGSSLRADHTFLCLVYPRGMQGLWQCRTELGVGEEDKKRPRTPSILHTHIITQNSKESENSKFKSRSPSQSKAISTKGRIDVQVLCRCLIS